MHKPIFSSDIQQLRAFKDRVKYYLNLKRLQAREQSADAPLLPKQKSTSKGIGQSLKKVYHATPEWVYANPVTSLGYKLLSKVLDRMITTLKSGIKPSFVLFEEGIAERFDFEKHDQPLVSIIIPVHNKYHYTHKCLYSILQHSSTISYQIIIGDDASTDETASIQERIGNIEISKHDPGLGFLRNCNHASRLARGKYILFLNNDTVVQPGWLDTLMQTIESSDEIGMVGSKLVYPEGLLQEAGGIIFSNGTGWNYGKLASPDGPEYNYVKEVDYISGAAIMLHKWLWDKLGGFDDRYAPAYYEDSDLAFEVRKAGLKVVYQPQSVVVHFEGISHGTDIGSGAKKYQEINRQKFVEKWSQTLQEGQFTDERHLFRARERNTNKKTLLFIDHYVPEFDRDAGSKSCFQYLNLFVKMGLNVKFIGDSFIRTEPYTTVLQQLGIEVLYGTEYQQGWENWVKENANDIDYVFFNRPYVTTKYIHFIKDNTQARLIYFGHDLHYLREERQYALTQDKSLLQSAKNWKKMEWDIFSKSDIVLYPSNEEIRIIRQQNPDLNAFVLPLNIYANTTAFTEQYAQLNKKDLLFVGGFNHPPNEDAVLWFVNEVFPIIRAQIPDVKFNIVGSKVTQAIHDLASPQVIVKGFVSDAELKQLYKNCRVVVAPLRYGAGVKGKIIEALYHRCAVVTTPVGAEGISNKEQLLTVAETATAFAQAVIDLYMNDQRIEQIYEQTPTYIHTYFSEAGVKRFVESKLLI